MNNLNTEFSVYIRSNTENNIVGEDHFVFIYFIHFIIPTCLT